MRIGIDARMYGANVGGGLGRYVAELVTHLAALDQRNHYVLFLGKENFHACTVRAANVEKRLVDIPWYSLAEQRRMPREIARARVQGMHFPHWNVPLFSHVPFVVTIHDLILLEDPASAHASTRHPFVHGLKYVGYRLALERAVHGSRQIITVSEHAKRSLLDHFRVPAKKITVVHNGVTGPWDAKGVTPAAFGIVRPYFLYVGSAYPHKNLDVLLEAFSEVHAEQPDVELVIAGRRDSFMESLEKKARKLDIPGENIRFVPSPDDTGLAALYSQALAFVMPSRHEGFGIPPLEAMRYGTPVVAAQAGALPEVLGDTATYFPPEDAGALAKALLAIAKTPLDTSARTMLMRHANHYRWEDAARQTLDVYATAFSRFM